MSPGSQPRRVPVTIAADAKANAEQIIPVNGNASGLVVSPNGKEVAFLFRGDVFVASVEGGVTKQITRTPAQETGIDFSPDGKALVYATERDGRWAIVEARRARESEPYFYASTLIRETPLIANANQNFQPQFSPNGRELAYVENLNTLRVLTLATGQSRTLLDNASHQRHRPEPPLRLEPRRQVDAVQPLRAGDRAG